MLVDIPTNQTMTNKCSGQQSGRPQQNMVIDNWNKSTNRNKIYRSTICSTTKWWDYSQSQLNVMVKNLDSWSSNNWERVYTADQNTVSLKYCGQFWSARAKIPLESFMTVKSFTPYGHNYFVSIVGKQLIRTWYPIITANKTRTGKFSDRDPRPR